MWGCPMKKAISTFFLLIISFLFQTHSHAGVIADCYPWSPSQYPDATANDCVLQIWDEPVVPDVDQVFVSMYVSSHVYTSAGYQGVHSENNGASAPYPGPINEVDIYTTIHSLVEFSLDNPPSLIEHNPYCWTGNFEYHYVPTNSYHLYRNVGGCGGWLGYTQLW